MGMFSPKLGIDLGTTNVLVFLPEKGVVLNEPSVVAVSTENNKVLAIGTEAKQMIGRTRKYHGIPSDEGWCYRRLSRY